MARKPKTVSPLTLVEERVQVGKCKSRSRYTHDLSYKPSKELQGVIEALAMYAQDVPSSDCWNYYMQEMETHLRRIGNFTLRIGHKLPTIRKMCTMLPETPQYQRLLRSFDAGPEIDWENIDQGDPKLYESSEQDQVNRFVSAYCGFYWDVNMELRVACHNLFSYLFNCGLAGTPLFAAFEKMFPGDRELFEKWAAQAA